MVAPVTAALKPYPAYEDSGVPWRGWVSEPRGLGRFHMDVITLEQEMDDLLDGIIRGDSQ